MTESFHALAGYPQQRHALQMAVQYVRGCGVTGDIIEFGCFQGLSMAVLAEALAVTDRTMGFSDAKHGIPCRQLWGLDSFQGFPEITNQIDKASPHIQSGVWFPGQLAGSSPEEVVKLCSNFIEPDRVIVIPGWYEETLVQIPPTKQFALIHIDCDFYESTIQVLDYLFVNDMVPDGATILFDDWYCNRGNPCFGEQCAWTETVANYDIHSTDWGPYGLAGRRFIVHRD